jgi:hypothetical protein
VSIELATGLLSYTFIALYPIRPATVPTYRPPSDIRPSHILGYLEVLLASLSVISSRTSTQPLTKPSLKPISVPDGSRLV